MTKAHALVIDDNAENIEVLSRLLAASGVTSTAVQDTSLLEQALQRLDPQADIVFLDIEMPRRSGYEILEVLRTALGDEFPIIACTVHSNEIATAREMGFTGFLAKPLNPLLFAAQLTRILSGEPVWDAS